MSARPFAILLATLATLAAASTLAAEVDRPVPDVERGRNLYELRCGECHAQSVHGRAHRVARNIQEVRQWVRRWSDELHLGWGREEVADVAAYLNSAYYHFDCAVPDCGVVSMTRPTVR